MNTKQIAQNEKSMKNISELAKIVKQLKAEGFDNQTAIIMAKIQLDAEQKKEVKS
jgi:hypothetical protein